MSSISISGTELLERPLMRAQGVRSLFVYCCRCHHQASLNVDNYRTGIPVPAFSRRMVCTRCGVIGADVRPAWNERAVVGAFNGLQTQ